MGLFFTQVPKGSLQETSSSHKSTAVMCVVCTDMGLEGALWITDVTDSVMEDKAWTFSPGSLSD